ncbi:hypothetical protein PIROE2DRAFT_10220, partial [Piromyces sp. E2]
GCKLPKFCPLARTCPATYTNDISDNVFDKREHDCFKKVIGIDVNYILKNGYDIATALEKTYKDVSITIITTPIMIIVYNDQTTDILQ